MNIIRDRACHQGSIKDMFVSQEMLLILTSRVRL